MINVVMISMDGNGGQEMNASSEEYGVSKKMKGSFPRHKQNEKKETGMRTNR